MEVLTGKDDIVKKEEKKKEGGGLSQEMCKGKGKAWM